MILLSTLIKVLVVTTVFISVTGGYYYFTTPDQSQKSEYFREQIVSKNSVESNHHNDKHLINHHEPVGWSSIRVRVDYSNVEPYVKKNQLSFIKDNLLGPATAFLQSALQVKNRINNTFISTKCGSYGVPAGFKAGQIFDLGIIVAAVNDPQGSWWLRGVSCELDSVTNRPILGSFQINLAIFNQVNVDTNKNEEWEYWLQQAIHEFIHLIGFNSVLYPYFINPQTNQALGLDSVIRTFKGRQYIILPPVLDRVKKYFSCNSAVGALLEDNGGADIAGFHWERVTFGNEIMTGDPFPDQVISEFTLALLEGTGWYVPNYTFAQNFGWGKDDGCLLTTGVCSVVYEEFCKLKDQQGCSNNFNSISGCFTGDKLSQDCYYWREQSDCRYHSDYSDKLASITGGSVGYGSQCFITSLAQNAFSAARSSCYNAQCLGGKVLINVNGQTLTCSTNGQVISVKVGGLSGTVTCPDLGKFCAQLQVCPNNCSNRGVCFNGTCKCWTGYQGKDCSSRQPSP